MALAPRIPSVDHYFLDGCGRCERYATERCSARIWSELLHELRQLMLESGMKEELKWSAPCYTHNGKNVAMIGAFKDNCVVSFFKGALIPDDRGILVKAGEYSQEGRVVRLRDVSEVAKYRKDILYFLQKAIEIEESGQQIEKASKVMELPDVMKERFAEDKELERAFYALTPGRQRGYIMHIGSAKNATTRLSRLEKCEEKIFRGKGFME